MPTPRNQSNDAEMMRNVLSLIESDNAITQRKLSGELGIALGLANSYIRRCVRKGLVKVSEAPMRRYAYYLTPRGFAEKSRLTAQYLAHSLSFFGKARADCRAALVRIDELGCRSVVIFGAGELAEIAGITAGEIGLPIAALPPLADADGILKPPSREVQLMLRDGSLGILFAELSDPAIRLRELREWLATHQLTPRALIVPEILGIGSEFANGR